ncbi:hypothetical protein LZ32DRAFT_662464 [Colletotrichum eremochloae]|nr:hypothetical protein LZ32DRAFT_662464 [Colletotrichum eremochloae]
MDKRHILALLSLIARIGNAAALGPAEPETYCFTYISTFLELAPLPTPTVRLNAIATVIGGTTVTIRATNSMAPDIVTVIGGTTVSVLNAVGGTIANAPGVGTTANIPSVRGGTTVSVLNAIGGIATNIPSVIGGTTANTQSVRGGTTVNVQNAIGGAVTNAQSIIGGTTVTATPTATNAIASPPSPISAGANSGSIIFFVFPAPGASKRGLQKRAYGGFLSNDPTSNRDSCESASIFTISLGQLLNAGSSTFYSPGDSFRQVLNAGIPPVNAITGGFDIVGGVLRFVNSSLPNGEANICQVSTGQVYLTFGSMGPDSCQPSILYAYPGVTKSSNNNKILCVNRIIYVNSDFYISRNVYFLNIHIYILDRDIYIFGICYSYTNNWFLFRSDQSIYYVRRTPVYELL